MKLTPYLIVISLYHFGRSVLVGKKYLVKLGSNIKERQRFGSSLNDWNSEHDFLNVPNNPETDTRWKQIESMIESLQNEFIKYSMLHKTTTSPITSPSSTLKPKKRQKYQYKFHKSKHHTRKERKEQNPYRCNCGRSSAVEISGGEGAIPHEFPWIVRIFGGCAKGLCGGALVSPRIVLSAYHCGYDISQNDTTLCDHSDGQRFAILGQQYINSYVSSSYPAEYAIPIIRVIAPPNGHFDPSDNNSHDFALFVLERPAVFDARVRPICLPYKGQEFYGKRSVAAGWGRTP